MTRRPAPHDPRQGSLFEPETPATTGSLQFDAEWRGALSDAIAASGKSREAIASEMERLLGNDPDYPVSRAVLDAWTAPSRSAWRFPAIYLPAFVQATGAHALVELLARKCGCLAVGAHDHDVLTLGQAMRERKRIDAEIRRLTRSLGDAPSPSRRSAAGPSLSHEGRRGRSSGGRHA